MDLTQSKKPVEMHTKNAPERKEQLWRDKHVQESEPHAKPMRWVRPKVVVNAMVTAVVRLQVKQKQMVSPTVRVTHTVRGSG